MSTKKGLSCKARIIIYQGTIGATWKYSSSIYSHKLETKTQSAIIERLYHQILLRVSRSYMTVLYLPLTVIANWPFIVLQIHKRSILNTLIHPNHEVENWSPFIGAHSLPHKP